MLIYIIHKFKNLLYEEGLSIYYLLRSHNKYISSVNCIFLKQNSSGKRIPEAIQNSSHEPLASLNKFTVSEIEYLGICCLYSITLRPILCRYKAYLLLLTFFSTIK